MPFVTILALVIALLPILPSLAIALVILLGK